MLLSGYPGLPEQLIQGHSKRRNESQQLGRYSSFNSLSLIAFSKSSQVNSREDYFPLKSSNYLGSQSETISIYIPPSSVSRLAPSQNRLAEEILLKVESS